MRSVAGQVFVLQVVIVLLLVVAAGIELVLQSRRDITREAANRSLAVAQAFANSPGIIEALSTPEPTVVLQPRAEAARVTSGVDFIVVMNTEGIRYTHPMPDRIGKKFVGTIAPALAGNTVIESVNGTIGPLVQATVPVKETDGSVVGIVSAGVRKAKIADTADQQLPLLLATAAGALALATAGTALVGRRLRRQTRGLGPAEMTRMYEHHDAVLHAVREGVLILDGSGTILLANDEARRLLPLPADTEGRKVAALGLDRPLADLLISGETVTDRVVSAGERLLAVNVRATDIHGGPPGRVVTLRDSTELQALSGRAELAGRRLKLLYDASGRIGTSLDVARTAQELADSAVPVFADFVTVDLAEPVLRGDEPGGTPSMMFRAGHSGVRPDSPFIPVGEPVPLVPDTPRARAMASGDAVLEPDLTAAFAAWQHYHPDRATGVQEYGVHALLTVPLQARGVVLGMASFWRSDRPEPFDEDDRSVAEELVARAALCIDNARRYTREHAMAVTLQHSLLPGGLPDQSALDLAYRYLPAQSGVGGDWFDVIPLSGARVALVVGDVVGHGLHAAATMGRLRTAVHTFSALDLPPDELLGHLDDLVNRIDQDASLDGDAPITGATCLYAIYDPVALRCTMARAGHLLPAVAHPDGSVEFPELPAGAPLGLVGMPFEAVDIDLPEGSHLVLYTDGLVEDRHRDIDEGLELLRASLAARPGLTPEKTCDSVLEAMLPASPTDDIALLVARTRALPAENVDAWEVPADPSAVSGVRGEVSRRLAEWGLDDLAFTTELILSELVTNAIRYGGGPIRVRLLRDRTLICEVSDSSSTSPHLKYAASTDEGGRGLFLVAQFAERWGTRYTDTGKVIWAEQLLP
ncbi:SpoIIE family protein phosphatase [Kitasatospora sp. NPDC085895]|uniref:SpoIIE family protein phosphatase n=1 Tax=Kitasatospora sp. NPDC085895 TaxID=3155057 RepID=UPI00344E8E6D